MHAFLRSSLTVSILTLVFLCFGGIIVDAAVQKSKNGCPIIARTIARGSRGVDVTALQKYFVTLGLLSSDSASGFFGALSEKALKKFQSMNGLASVGSTGPKTRALIASCKSKPVSGVFSGQTQQGSGSTLFAGGASGGTIGGSPGAKGNPGTRGDGGQVPAPPSACAFGAKSLSEGESVTAYESSTVPSGATCKSETRACTTGTLSGSYTASSCVPLTDQPFSPGYPLGPMVHSYGYSSKIVQEFQSTGIHVYNVDTNIFGDDSGFTTPVETADGQWDFSKLLDTMGMIAAADPQAKFILRPAAGSPDWWKDGNLSELEQDQSGNPKGPNGRYASPYSSKLKARWATGVQKIKEALVAKGLDTRVIGLVLTGENSQEWMNGDNLFNVYSNIRPLVYGPLQKNVFQSWSAQRGTNCSMPTESQFNAASYIGDKNRSMFLNPTTSLCVIEYYRFRSASKIDEIEYLSQLFRNAFPQRKIGVIYGYFNEIGGNPSAGHGALIKLLGLSSVDYINPMPSYLDRLTPGTQIERQPFTSVALHGKSLFTDLDQGSNISKINYDLLCDAYKNSGDPHLLEVWRVNCDSGDPGSLYAYQMAEAAFPSTVTQTLQNWTNFAAFSIARGVSFSYLSLHNWIQNKDTDKSYMSDPTLLAGVSNINRVKAQSASYPVASVAEVLVVSDEDSSNFVRYGEAGVNKQNSYQTLGDMSWQSLSISRLGLSQMGAPYDHVFMSDLQNLDVSRYKLVVFLNPWSVDSSMRATIASKLKNNGRVLVFNYASGYYKDGSMSTDNIKDLVGITIQKANDLYKPGILTDSSQKPIFSQAYIINPSFMYDTDYFYPADPGAYVIGKQSTGSHTGSPSVAYKELSTWKSIWTPTVALSAGAFADIAKWAGVHMYSASGDPLYINASYASLVAKSAGQKMITFPNAVKVYDATSGSLLQSGKDTYLFYLNSGDVKILRYEIDASVPKDACAIDANSGGPAIASWAAPTRMRVYQRNGGSATVPVSAKFAQKTECVRIRVTTGDGKEVAPWKTISKADVVSGQTVSGDITFNGNDWYKVEVQGIAGNKAGALGTIDYVGVGDVFIVAGGTNASFFGESKQKSTSGRVVYFDGSTWKMCEDPLPAIDSVGTGGSPWCLIGDDVAAGFGAPVAMVPVGLGVTTIDQWQQNAATSPIGSGYLNSRLMDRLRLFGPRGVKAILWHHGENDAATSVTTAAYADGLNKLISDSRAAAGFQVPWLVSRATYPAPSRAADPIRAAQNSVIDNSTVFAGPDTDPLGGIYRDSTYGLYFNNAGLVAARQLWDSAIAAFITH